MTIVELLKHAKNEINSLLTENACLEGQIEVIKKAVELKNGISSDVTIAIRRQIIIQNIDSELKVWEKDENEKPKAE